MLRQNHLFGSVHVLVWYFFVLPPTAQVYEELAVGGAFDDGNIARSNLFLSVHDAIVFAQQTSGERQVSPKVGPPTV